ncbi:hypothetical protein ACFS5M_11320 [Lacinutrix iliipiscaria]|uniref:Uncharacterized protein n=1 Tax=Lacinutrix iliipiscaria TaxID=1230532 RepID=A0ABW5WSM8_9FLAO
MKTSITLLALFISTLSFAQTLEQQNLLKKNYYLFDSYTFENIHALKENLKKTSFPIKNLNEMSNGSLVFTPQNFNKNISSYEFPKYRLQKELQKVMLEIPGLTIPIDYESFKK